MLVLSAELVVRAAMLARSVQWRAWTRSTSPSRRSRRRSARCGDRRPADGGGRQVFVWTPRCRHHAAGGRRERSGPGARSRARRCGHNPRWPHWRGRRRCQNGPTRHGAPGPSCPRPPWRTGTLRLPTSSRDEAHEHHAKALLVRDALAMAAERMAVNVSRDECFDALPDGIEHLRVERAHDGGDLDWSSGLGCTRHSSWAKTATGG